MMVGGTMAIVLIVAVLGVLAKIIVDALKGGIGGCLWGIVSVVFSGAVIYALARLGMSAKW